MSLHVPFMLAYSDYTQREIEAESKLLCQENIVAHKVKALPPKCKDLQEVSLSRLAVFAAKSKSP